MSVQPSHPIRDHQLIPTQVQQYWDAGFLSNIEVLTPDETLTARWRIESVEAQERARRGGRWEDRHFQPWMGGDHPLRETFHQLARHPKLLDAVCSVLGPNVLIGNADVFIKEPGHPMSVAWHLDTSMNDETADEYLTAWLGLGVAGSTPESGGLVFNEGGHRVDLPDRPKDRHSLNLSPTALGALDRSRHVDNVMPTGHASLHHALMPHFSGGNGTRHRRIGFVVRYMSTRISKQMAELGEATLVRGVDNRRTFQLRDDFPVNWTPQHP